jgi:tocopherol cyclase
MPLRTPHSGCHWDGRRRPFFEGWYYRLTLPPSASAAAESIAFMVSLQTPAGSGKGETPAGFGGAVQILGPQEQLVCRSFPDLSTFWAHRDRLGHGQHRDGHDPERGMVREFYHASAHHHEGCIRNPATGEEIRWCFSVEPRYGWGDLHRRQQSTAGWLSRFPIFEPGWQILMAHGWASGWIDCRQLSSCSSPSLRRHFDRVPAYAEKNWGGSFPSQWFWVQCNAFEQHPDLTLTSAGGIRKVLGRQECVGLVGIHHHGTFYEFVPWNAQVSWQVDPWGCWRIWAEQKHYRVELLGTCTDAGVLVQVPTASGLRFLCRDTTQGQLRLKLWRRRGQAFDLVLEATSQQAGLEVGGGEWSGRWEKLA